jgi:hypothetical protein
MFKRIRRWFQRPKDCSGNVYYVRLATSEGILYKIGFTKKPFLNERFEYSGQGDEKLIDKEFLFTFREDAWDIEQTLLDHFAKFRAFGKYSNDPAMPLAGRGQTELFRRDVLGLDEELYALSEKLAMELKESSEHAAGGCLLSIIGLCLAPFTLGWSLFLIAGGMSDIFGSNVKPPMAERRPEHPIKIQKLIETLSQKVVITSKFT